MGLQFEGLVDIQKIQFLSHQYKIPSTIELFVGTVSQDSPFPDYESAEYKRLGYSFEHEIHVLTNVAQVLIPG